MVASRVAGKDELSRDLRETDPRFLAEIAGARRRPATGKRIALDNLEP